MRTQEERDEQTLDIVFMLGKAALLLVALAVIALVVAGLVRLLS